MELTASFPLFLATASISSIKIIQGLCLEANLNKSLTLLAPTPTYFSENSLPDTGINEAFISPQNPLAIKVLPLPGGPSKIIPLGDLTLYFSYLV